MYSNSWKVNINIITSLQLYRVDNVVKYLHDMRDFIITTPGKLSENHIPVLKPDYTPSEDMRFPENTIFLCEGYGNWCDFYYALLLCTSAMLNPNRLARKYTEYSTQGEAEQTALDLIAEMLGMIYENAHGVNREMFESRYSLEWSVPESSSYTAPVKNAMEKMMEIVKKPASQNNAELEQQDKDNEEKNQENEELSS